MAVHVCPVWLAQLPPVHAYDVAAGLQLAVRTSLAPVVPLALPEIEQDGGPEPPPPQVKTKVLALKLGFEQPEIVTFWLCATSGVATRSIPQTHAKASAINDFVITFSLQSPA